jgi:hypothetical protein
VKAGAGRCDVIYGAARHLPAAPELGKALFWPVLGVRVPRAAPGEPTLPHPRRVPQP